MVCGVLGMVAEGNAGGNSAWGAGGWPVGCLGWWRKGGQGAVVGGVRVGGKGRKYCDPTRKRRTCQNTSVCASNTTPTLMPPLVPPPIIFWRGLRSKQ